jgi:alpha-ketoglutarate-dependent taurine dioxygenase
MSIAVKPIRTDFGAEICGIDLSRPLRQFVHAHRWRQGDLVIWDNRCTMHRARPFGTTKVRDLRRVTTRDVASTLEQAA